MSIKKYPHATLQLLSEAIRDSDQEAQDRLVSNGYPELSHWWDAVEGIESSFQWLMQHEQRPLAAVVDALSGKDTAKLWLLRSGYPQLAAFVDAAQGNASAVKRLAQDGENGWLLVAKEIHARQKKRDKNILWGLFNLGNPFR